MILFDNNLVKLDYNPATDILEVAYPDLYDFLLAGIKQTITAIVDIIKHYDIKKILLDSSKTVIAVGAEETREITMRLAAGLRKTRLQRIARVKSADPKVETLAQGNISFIFENETLPFQLQSFTDKESARNWLMAGQ